MHPYFKIFGPRSIAFALALFAFVGSAQAVEVLYAFQGGADGAGPISGVIRDRLGNLYGTTWQGGGTGCGGSGCGTIFRIAPDGTETVLYAFKGGSDGGGYPISPGLIRDRAGNLYGTTTIGGDLGCGSSGCGTVFELAPTGTKAVLHNFESGSDGAYPEGRLLRDKAGNLYGTTEGGGPFGLGTVFKIAPGGAETVLYAFGTNGYADGNAPLAGLIADAAGNLYGTASGGGINDGGAVFRLAKNGVETVLYSFCSLLGCPDGSDPRAGVTLDQAGNLYGTTQLGGAKGLGAVFKVAPDGTETVVHSFDPNVDGEVPQDGVIIDRAGNLYGTQNQNLATLCRANSGFVYKIAPDGSEKLRCVPGPAYGGVILRKGSLYGTAVAGGPSNSGFVFAMKK